MRKTIKDVEKLLSKHGFNKIENELNTNKKYYNSVTNTYFYFISHGKKIFRFNGLVNYCSNGGLLNNDLQGVANYTVLYYSLIGFIQANIYKV